MGFNSTFKGLNVWKGFMQEHTAGFYLKKYNLLCMFRSVYLNKADKIY